MENLKFRRQFLLTSKECKELNHWKQERLDSFFIYIHPECSSTVFKEGDSSRVMMIGYAFNPNHPNETEIEILKKIAEVSSLEEITKLLYPLVGRFVLIIKGQKTYVFHDACGLKSVFFYI